jgi:hypothetical protein
MRNAVHVIDGALWDRYGDNMQFRIIQDSVDRCVHVMARPNMESVRGPTRFTSVQYDVAPFPWADSRWARFLRWLNERVKLPEPLRALVTEKRWTASLKVDTLPADTIESVRIQMAELERRRVKPLAICCGPLGRDRLYSEVTAWTRFYPAQSDVMCPELFGLPIRIIPWMEPHAVMVV